MESLIPILQISIYALIALIIFLGGMLYFFVIKERTKKEIKEEETMIESDKKEEAKKAEDFGRFKGELTTESILNFMDFEEVVDNMIIRKKGTQYVMVLQCNGVNYDLMSEQEKIAVEEGFVQFLNTLRFPIQLYVQSRTLNLRDIITEYKERVDSMAMELDKTDAKIAQAQMSGNKALKEKLEFEKRRKTNVLEYGINITDYIEKLSSNQNILQQRTYVIVPYYSAEMGVGTDNYSKEELYNMCFSELYTRCQNIASALGTSQVTCKILDSEELAELLYIAYNRDESELLQLSKAIDAQYDALYSTGKEVLQKKQEKLDREINIEAIDLATDSILKADKQKEIEELELTMNREDLIKERALDLIDTYENQLDPRVYELAKEEVDKSIEEVKKQKSTKEKETPKLEEPVQGASESKRKIIRRKQSGN